LNIGRFSNPQTFQLCNDMVGKSKARERNGHNLYVSGFGVITVKNLGANI
jgi:hypothetical protein